MNRDSWRKTCKNGFCPNMTTKEFYPFCSEHCQKKRKHAMTATLIACKSCSRLTIGDFCSTDCLNKFNQLDQATKPLSPSCIDELESLCEEAVKICRQRTETYSRGALSLIELDYTAVGNIWAAVLSKHWGEPVEPLPAHVACLMMAAMKTLRASGNYHRDNFVDALNYLAFASNFQQKEKTK